MTTETNDNDPRVSDAYHEMASEQTPAELDHKILAMAAAEARATRGLPRTWFRPLAWAATIALSFALVLEITQVDDAAVPRTDADLAESLEESTAPTEASGKQIDDARLSQQLNKRSPDAPAAAKPTITPAQPEPAARDTAANTPAPERASVASDFEGDLGLVREAEEQMRMRSESARAADAFAEKKEQLDGCGADARTGADAWYECVRGLRDSGHVDLAQLEFEALLVEFPDFREPSGDQQHKD